MVALAAVPVFAATRDAPSLEQPLLKTAPRERVRYTAGLIPMEFSSFVQP